MKYSMIDELIRVGLVLVLFFSVILILEMIYSKYKDNRELKIFRHQLKRGDKIRVRGMKDPQIVYSNPMTGKIIINMYEKKHWYKSVNVTDVYPFEDSVEYEIVHE